MLFHFILEGCNTNEILKKPHEGVYLSMCVHFCVCGEVVV